MGALFQFWANEPKHGNYVPLPTKRVKFHLCSYQNFIDNKTLYQKGLIEHKKFKRTELIWTFPVLVHQAQRQKLDSSLSK